MYLGLLYYNQTLLQVFLILICITFFGARFRKSLACLFVETNSQEHSKGFAHGHFLGVRNVLYLFKHFGRDSTVNVGV